ncbi:magnesium/cobalt transporter CorA [Candidatus Woesearchaeota archaeon]|nr:magnesium/cobalt transporter CorA [Candidatus Woesearchaeota archaeon]
MITAYWRPNGKVVKGSIDALKSRKTAWIDCINPTTAELEKISKLTGVPAVDFSEHIVNYERPTTIESDKYSLIIFGSPVARKHLADVASCAIFLCNKHNIVTIRTKEIEWADKFRDELINKNPKYFDSRTRTVQVILEKMIDSYFDHLEKFQEATDKIESIVFKNPQRKSVEETFKIRKVMLFFHKTLVANREVMLAIEKQHISRLNDKKIQDYRDMREDIIQLIDTTDTLRSVLTSVLDIYTSAVSNQMNQAMKKLTVIASYVLIPTLIASIYGMNFRFMPEIPWKLGYPFSLALMIVSILVVYFYFKKTKML